MGLIYASLTVANIAAAKALTATSQIKRVDGMWLAIANTGSGFPGWYRYSAASPLPESLPSAFRPTDDVGAWLQFSGGGGGGSNQIDFSGGTTFCEESCSVGAKAFQFTEAQFGLIQIVVDSAIASSIPTATNAIQISLWSQEPNSYMEGRQFVAEIPKTGGSVFIAPDTYRSWLTVQARNTGNGGVHDGTCCSFSGNTVTLLSFGD